MLLRAYIRCHVTQRVILSFHNIYLIAFVFRYIGKRHVMNAIAIVENAMLSKNVKFVLVRVPLFLEPGYINKPPDFWESHDERMLRKFGSMQAFERFKAQHGLSKVFYCDSLFVISFVLVPRGREVGLDDSVGYNDENLSRRRQSSTLNAHRLVYYIAKVGSTFIHAKENLSFLCRSIHWRLLRKCMMN